MPLISTLGVAGSQSFGTRGIQAGGSASIFSTGSRFSFPTSTAFNYGTGNFTIEAWVYPTTFGGTRVIWRQADNIWLGTLDAGQLIWATGSGGYILGGVPTLNAWNHIAVVRNSNSVRIFLNGVAYASSADSVNITTPSAAPLLGCYQANGSYPFRGYITNFRIAKQALYSANFIPSLVPFTRTSQNSTTTSLLLNMRSSTTITTDSSSNNLFISSTNVTYSTFSPYLQPYVTPPTVVVSSATVTPTTFTPNEGTTITVNVVGTNTANGTYYYSLQEELGTGALTAADFTSGSLTGSFTISGGVGSFPLTVTSDLLTEGNEIFTIYVRTTSPSGQIIGTSAEVTITDSSLTPAFTVAPTDINEGVAGTFTVQNIGSDGTYFFTVLNSTTSNADFSATSGSFVVSGSTGGLDNGTGSFSITPIADRTTEGPQFFQVQVRSGSTSGTIILTSGSITVIDTSPTPGFISAPSSINEGSSGNFQVNNLGPAGTYYWTILNITTVDADFVAANGFFVTGGLNGTGSFDVTPAADLITEGEQTFRVQVRDGSITGTVLATSPFAIAINDTSLTQPYPTISTATQAFRFEMDAGVLPFLTDTSPNAWIPPLASRGTTGLSVPAGSPYTPVVGRVFLNQIAGNSAGIATLSGASGTPVAYATYHNTNIATSNWTMEFNFQATNEAVNGANIFESGVTKVNIAKPAGLPWRASITLSSDTTANTGQGYTVSLGSGVTINTWYHIVISMQVVSSTSRVIRAYVDGVLTETANITTPSTYYFYSASTLGAYIGVSFFTGASFYLDNCRLLAGLPFPTAGFVPPTTKFNGG